MGFSIDIGAGNNNPVPPLQPAAGVAAAGSASAQKTSEQTSADTIGDVVTSGTQDGLTLTYDSVQRNVDVVNTDKGSVAVAAHEALDDPHPVAEFSRWYNPVREYLPLSEPTFKFAAYNDITVGAAETLDLVVGSAAIMMSVPGGSTVVEGVGYYVDSNTVDPLYDFAYGYFSDIEPGAPDTRWNFYAGGLAENWFGGKTSFGRTIVAPAGVAGYSPLRVPHGVAPSAPVNGDVWTTTAGVYARVNGATVGPLKDGTDLAAHLSAPDPHPIYSSPAEVTAEVVAGISAHEAAPNPHPIYETAAEVAAQIATHAALPDPHPGYETTAEGAARVASHVSDVDPHGDRSYVDTYYLPLTGGTVTGDITISGATPQIVMDNTGVGNAPQILFKRGGVNRWLMYMPQTEAGADTGSDFFLAAYDDAGVQKGSPFIIDRETLSASFSGQVIPNGGVYRAGTLNLEAGTTLNLKAGTTLNLEAGTTTRFTIGGVVTADMTATYLRPNVTAVMDLGGTTKRWNVGWFTDVVSTTFTGDLTGNVTGNASGNLLSTGGTLSGKLTTVASSGPSSGLTLPHGVAPTVPVDGDLWTTTAGVYARVNGTTVGPLGTGGGGGGAGLVLGTGTSIIDFGAGGMPLASLVVTGQAAIVAGSLVQCWIKPEATTDHTVGEHIVEDIKVVAAEVVAGVGFTLYAMAPGSPVAVTTSPLSVLGRSSGAGQNPGPGRPERVNVTPVPGRMNLLKGKWSVAWLFTA